MRAGPATRLTCGGSSGGGSAPQESCERKTFTERLPQVPPRCRVTARLREQAAREVAERGITPAEAARHAGLSWPVAHDAFAAAADRILDAAA